MNKENVWFWMVARLALVLLAALSLAGCGSRARVGALQSESQSVELGDASSVRVEIDLGAGDLQVTSGAEKLLEADFTYNVARLKPEVEYKDGTLVLSQPDVRGLPVLRDITDFRNEWDLRLYDEVPMELSVNVGGGLSNLKLAGLSLTRLDIDLGAGISTIDLSGDWVRDLNVTINAGATDISVILPADVGVRIEVEDGPHMIEASDLKQNGDFFTNAAYDMSEVTLQIDMETGIGRINLEVEETASASD